MTAHASLTSSSSPHPIQAASGQAAGSAKDSKDKLNSVEPQKSDASLLASLGSSGGTHVTPARLRLASSSSQHSDTSDVSQGSPTIVTGGSPFRRAASDRLREARSFFGRIGSLRDKKGSKCEESSTGSSGKSLEISSPVLIDSPDVRRKMAQLGCYDLYPATTTTTTMTSPAYAGHEISILLSDHEQSSKTSSSKRAKVGSSPVASRSSKKAASSTSVTVKNLSETPVINSLVASTVMNDSQQAVDVVTNHKDINQKNSSSAKLYPHVAPVVKRFSSLDTMPDDGTIPLEHRLSIYDNVPPSSAEDIFQCVGTCNTLLLSPILSPFRMNGLMQRSTPQLTASCYGGDQLFDTVFKSSSFPAVDFGDCDTLQRDANMANVMQRSAEKLATNTIGQASFVSAAHNQPQTTARRSPAPERLSNSPLKVVDHNQERNSRLSPSKGQMTKSKHASSASPSPSRRNDPRKELDIVLQELLNNIGDLSLQLTGGHVYVSVGCFFRHCALQA